jgi:Skp family chaperone for outer membrane proteins
MSGMAKLHILTLSLALGTVFSTLALAQGATSPAQPAQPAAQSATPGKIGIVNIQDAIGGCNEGQRDFAALQTRFSPKKTELDGLAAEINTLQTQYKAQEATLAGDVRATRARAIDTKQKAYQRSAEDAQNEFQQAEQEVFNRIGQKMLNVLEKYAKANGYSVVLDVSNPQTPVLWASQGNVITKQLVDAYNAESGVAAPPAKPAGATAPAPRPAAPRPAAPTGTATPKKPQ